MFARRQLVENPIVLRRHNLFENKFVYKSIMAKGLFYRIIPSTWREISYIRMLDKGFTYEVPAEGDGLLIAHKAMPLK
jgi:hypothetical protein|tara:strand:+ start:395 stop:628 length:234 start_codon:yes stop_codon:yes gene_type:complete